MKSTVLTAATFELLEPRQLRSVSSPTPADGSDLHLSLDTNDAVVVSTTPNKIARDTSLPFQWLDGTSDHAVIAAGGTAFQGAQCDGYFMWPDIPGVGPDISGGFDQTRVRQLARDVDASGYKVIVIDNEVWGFDIRYHTRAEVDQTIAGMKQMLGWIKDERPNLKIGVYGYMSQSDDTAAVQWEDTQNQIAVGQEWYMYHAADLTDTFARWQATSEYLRPLSESVDYVFPALYTGVTDPDQWEKSARITIEDSRRYGKPVIPFIWPLYHPSVGGGLGRTEIPIDFWNREVALVKELADGAYIYNERPAAHNAQWVQTLIRASGSQSQSRPIAPLALGQADAASTTSDSHDSLFSDESIDVLHSI